MDAGTAKVKTFHWQGIAAQSMGWTHGAGAQGGGIDMHYAAIHRI